MAGSCDNDRVSRIIGNTTGFCENFQNGYRPIRLIHHGVRNGANHSNGLALVFLDGNAYVRMRDQAVRFEHLRDFLLCLHFGESGHVQTYRNQRDANRASLADTNLAAQLLYVKNVNVEKIPSADHIVVRHHPQVGGHLTNALICLLRCLENRLCAAGRRERHSR